MISPARSCAALLGPFLRIHDLAKKETPIEGGSHRHTTWEGSKEARSQVFLRMHMRRAFNAAARFSPQYHDAQLMYYPF